MFRLRRHDKSFVPSGERHPARSSFLAQRSCPILCGAETAAAARNSSCFHGSSRWETCSVQSATSQ